MKNNTKKCFEELCKFQNFGNLISSIPKDFSSYNDLNNFYNSIYSNPKDKYPSINISPYIHLEIGNYRCLIHKKGCDWQIYCSNIDLKITLSKKSVDIYFSGHSYEIKSPNVVVELQELFKSGVQNFM